MRKFIFILLCLICSATKANPQFAAIKTTVAQSANNDSSQENTVKNKIKEANKAIIPADPARSAIPELTLQQAKVLEGTITNQYGIRDDIYEYIQTHIPEDNIKTHKAAIKYAQYYDQIYYHAANKRQALELEKKESLADFCLSLSSDNWLTIARGIDKLMRDNPDRDKRLWDIDEKYFGWEALGSGLTDSEERKKCNSGSF